MKNKRHGFERERFNELYYTKTYAKTLNHR